MKALESMPSFLTQMMTYSYDLILYEFLSFLIEQWFLLFIVVELLYRSRDSELTRALETWFEGLTRRRLNRLSRYELFTLKLKRKRNLNDITLII